MSILNDSLNLFSEPLEDNSIEEEYYLSYNCDDLTTPGTQKQKFVISVKDKDSWINFSKAYLEYSVRLKAADGVANIAAGADIAVQQGHIFERCELMVDNQLVESVQFANHASNIHNLATIGPSYMNTTGEQMNMHLDTNTGAAEPDQAEAAYNSGFELRKELGAAGNLQTFYYPLNKIWGFCGMNKCTRGLRHQITLYRNTHGNMIHQSALAAANSKVYIEKVRLWVPIVKPSLESIVRIESSLNSGMPMKLNWESKNMYRSGAIPANDINFSYRVTTSLVNPTHCFVCFQQTATDDDETENNAIYTTENISEIELRLNQTQYPREKLEVSFPAASRNVARAYQMFESYKNKFGDSETGSVVSQFDFTNLYPIYHFDLTKADKAIFNQNGGADIEVRARRTGAAAGDTHCYVLILSDREATVSGPANNLRLDLL